MVRQPLRQLLPALLAASAFAACDSTPARTGSGSSIGIDAGAPVGPDSGTPGAGGSPDAGSSTGGADGGTTSDGGTVDAGTATDAGGGGAGGGTADAGTTLSECDGLAPEPVGAPNGTHTMEADRVDCAYAVNGSGFIAFEMSNALQPQKSAVHLVRPDGTVLSKSPSGTTVSLIGRLSNFVGLGYTFQPGTLSSAVQSWDSSGNLVSTGPSRPDSGYIAEDPLGGIALLRRVRTTLLENYDERVTLRWSVALSSRITAIGAFAVDRLGNTFVMADDRSYDKSVVAQWIDHNGVASPAFQLLPPQHDWNHLEGSAGVRVGSGLFVKGDAWWQLDSMSTVLTPPPAWFVDRGGPWMQMVRNGRAYGIV